MAEERSMLERGLILDGSGANYPSEARIIETTTRTGDHVVAATHHGYGYKGRNEDRVAFVERLDGASCGQSSFFVIDGMGGHLGGDVAAQVLAEELVDASALGPEQLSRRASELLLTRIYDALERLPSPDLLGAIVKELHTTVLADSTDLGPKQIRRKLMDIVKAKAVGIVDPDIEELRSIAEVVQALSRISIPGRTEIAVEKAKARMREFSTEAKPPDACYVGSVITSEEGKKCLDVAQAGDCKLFVADHGGRIKFQSLSESYISEPNLLGDSVTLNDLMMYSLNRNIVSNSVYSPSYRPRRYRAVDIPLDLEEGDAVYLYSDGFDDLFSPQEIIQLASKGRPADFLRSLLRWSERRMRYVSALLEEVRRRSSGAIKSVYPTTHRLINEARLQQGCYFERYADGTTGKWIKPPKCDNLAFCMITIGGADE